MKKPMLYISLIMTAIYVAAVTLIIVLQEEIRSAQGIGEGVEMPFIIPVSSLVICIILVAANIVFSILLMRAADDMRTNMEMAAVIVLSGLMVLMPWMFSLGMVMQSYYYVYMVGTAGIAAYNVVCQGITACNPIMVFAMLLQVIHAGIALGRKGR